MKHLIYIISATALCLSAIVSCQKKETPITPSSLSNLRSVERPGGIALYWDLPSDNSVYYTKVMYHDHLLNIDEVRLSSCDSIYIPDTRAKFGDYNFTIQPVSKTETGGEVLSITAKSGAAPASFGQATQVELKVEHLSTNAQEPSEGNISNLLDYGNDASSCFFHTAWSVGIPGPHWLQIQFPKKVEKGFFRFSYLPRKNNAQKPTDFDLMGSENGTDWTLIKNFTKEKDNLPVTSKDGYTSPNIRITTPLNYIRIVVNKTNTNNVFFTMREFKLFTGPMIDPEAD